MNGSGTWIFPNNFFANNNTIPPGSGHFPNYTFGHNVAMAMSGIIYTKPKEKINKSPLMYATSEDDWVRKNN